jgi:hypothetical protein
VELPACNSKWALYRSFLVSRGWEVGFDNKSRLVSQPASATTEEEESPVSWPAFCRFWRQYYPKIVIKKPSEDLCDDCVVFANRHKYGKDLLKSEGEYDDDSVRALTNVDYEKLQEAKEEQEKLVLEAAKHVEMARAQRQLFVSKKLEAKAKRNLPQKERTYTYVCDFAQNMYLPNFAAEQPGATYYFSPLNAYPFGIVDCSQDPLDLTAMVFACNDIDLTPVR